MNELVTLKSLVQESKDGEWGKGESFADSVRMAVVRGTDFDSVRVGDVASLPVRYISKRLAERKALRAGDIVIETAGGSRDRPTGRTVLITPRIVSRSELSLTCASFSRFIRIDRNKADARYVFWVLQDQFLRHRMWQYNTRHTGVARFQYTIFSETEKFRLPERDVQQKIAAILCAYDDLIENGRRRIKILEEMARTIYREWFVELRAPGVKLRRATPAEMKATGKRVFPEGWEVMKLGDLADVNALSIGKKNVPDTINYIDIASVSSGRIEGVLSMPFRKAPGRARRIVTHGDIIWSCVRPNRKSYSLILEPLPDLVVSTGFAVLTARRVPYAYLYESVTTDGFVGYLTNHAVSGDVSDPAVQTEEAFEVSHGVLDAVQRLPLIGPVVVQEHVFDLLEGGLVHVRGDVPATGDLSEFAPENLLCLGVLRGASRLDCRFSPDVELHVEHRGLLGFPSLLVGVPLLENRPITPRPPRL